MIQRVMLTLAIAGVVFATAGGLRADEEDSGQILFAGETPFGRVWANLSLTGEREGEPFVPMALGVQNLSSSKVRLDRTSFWLSDLDGSFQSKSDGLTARSTPASSTWLAEKPWPSRLAL